MKEWKSDAVKKVFLSVLAAIMAVCVLFGIFAFGSRANTALVVGAEDVPTATADTPQAQAVDAYKRYYALFMDTPYDEETAGTSYVKFVTDLQSAAESEINNILKDAIAQFFGRWGSVAPSAAEAQRTIIDEKIDAMGEGVFAVDLDDDLTKAISEVKLFIHKIEKKQELNDVYEGLSASRMSGFMASLDACKSKAENDIDAVELGDKTLDAVQATIDGIVDQAKIDFRTLEIEGVSSQEYYDSYQAITGTSGGETVPEDVLDALTAVKEAVDTAVAGDYGTTSTRYELVVAWNKNIAAAIHALIDGLLVKVNDVLVDSQATYEIVAAAKQAVTGALNGAKVGEVPDFSEAVTTVNADISAQRAAEKAAAKSEMQSAVTEIKGENTYPQDLETALSDLKTATEAEIDGANYNVYSLIVDRFVGKVEFLNAFSQFVTWAAAYDVSVDYSDAVSSALAAIGEAGNANGVVFARQSALLAAEKSYASELLQGLVADSSEDVKEVVSGSNGYTMKVAYAKSADEIKTLVEEAVVAMHGEEFLDLYSVLRKDLSTLAAGDKAALETAKTALAALSDEKVKAYLDAESAYISLEKEIEDRTNKADYEAKKSEVLGEIAKLININNVDVVLSTLEELRDEAEAQTYVSHLDDDTREKYLSDRKAALDTILSEAKQLSESAAKMEEKLQQFEEQLQTYLDSDDYSDAQKQEMRKKTDEYAAKASGVLAEAVDANAAERALDDLFAQAADELSQEPVMDVTEVTTSGVSAENGDYAEGYEGDALWGTVTNDSGMKKGTVLSVGKKENVPIDGIEEAVKNGKLKAAAGSELTKSQMEDLLDNTVVLATLDISLKNGDVTLDSFTGKYVVKILLPAELREKALVLVCTRENGDVEVFDAQVSEDGKYLTFTTDHFSEYVVLGEGPVTNLWWLVITLTVVVGLELVLLLVILLKKGSKKNKKEKVASVLPLGLLALVVPADVTYVCIVLGVAAAVLAIGIILAIRAKR